MKFVDFNIEDCRFYGYVDFFKRNFLTRTLDKREPNVQTLKNLGYLLIGWHVCPLSRKCWNSKKGLAHVPNSENVTCHSLIPPPDLTSRYLTLKQVRSFEEVLPFSCLICFSSQDGVWELDVSFVVHLLRWFFCLLGRGSLYSLVLGALVYLQLVGFHQVGI
jgi:hypothetical protein